MGAALEQVLTLLKLLSSEVAAKDRAAAAVHSVSEVLAGDADAPASPVLQLSVVDEAPLFNHQHASSTNALVTQTKVQPQARATNSGYLQATT